MCAMKPSSTLLSVSFQCGSAAVIFLRMRDLDKAWKMGG